MPGFSQTQTCPLISEVFQTLSGPISKICFAESDSVVSTLYFPFENWRIGTQHFHLCEPFFFSFIGNARELAVINF